MTHIENLGSDPKFSCGCLLAIVSKSCQEIVLENTVSESTTNGVFAFDGAKAMRMMSRSPTIIREQI